MSNAYIDHGEMMFSAQSWRVQLLDREIVITCNNGLYVEVYRFSRVTFNGVPNGCWRVQLQDESGNEKPASIATTMSMFSWIVENYGGDWNEKRSLITGELIPKEETS